MVYKEYRRLALGVNTRVGVSRSVTVQIRGDTWRYVAIRVYLRSFTLCFHL